MSEAAERAQRSQRRERRWGLWLLAGVALATFPGLFAFPLQEPDEGRYAGIAAGMARGEGWLIPLLNAIPYFEKPPLAFWLSAVSIRLLGPSELGARLPSALASFATVLLVCHWGRRVRAPAHGLFAGAILAGLPLMALLSRSVLVDVPLMAFTTCALYAGWRGLLEPDPGAPALRGWVRACWAACALAVLTKGPVGLVLPLSGLVTALCIGSPRQRLRELCEPAALALFVAIAAPWYVMMTLRAPGYAWAFFVEQNMQRFATGGRFGREGELWSYVPLLAFALLPWSALLPRALGQSVRAGLRLWRAEPAAPEAARADRLALYLLACSAVPFVILSVAQSKRAYYVLPLLPPLALLFADALGQARRALAVGLAALGAFSALAALLVAALIHYDAAALAVFVGEWQPGIATGETTAAELELLRAGAPALVPWLALLCATIGAAALALRRPPTARAAALAAGGMIAASAALPFALGPLGPLYSVQGIGAAIDANLQPGEIVFAYPKFLRGLPFYLNRPVLLYHASHEEFGHSVRPELVVGLALQRSPAALKRALQTKDGMLVVVSGDEHIRELAELAPGPVEIVQRGLRHTLVRIPPLPRNSAGGASHGPAD